jgi:myo-inositol-1-phosphate synthase
MKERLGVWIVGAFGGVASTVALGIAALKRGGVDTTGLATALPRFASLSFPTFDEIVIGGHDVRRSTFHQGATELRASSGVFSDEWIERCREDLDRWSQNVRPGIVLHSGRPVESFADWTAGTPMSPRSTRSVAWRRTCATFAAEASWSM